MMKLNTLGPPKIIYVNQEEDWEVAEGVERVFSLSKIRPNRDKVVTQAALVGDEVVGGVYSGWVEDTDREAWVYSFDVAVHPEYRASKIGVQLINAAIAEYANDKGAYGDRTMISLYVINPRLADYLEQKLGFEVEADYSHGAFQLVKY